MNEPTQHDEASASTDSAVRVRRLHPLTLVQRFLKSVPAVLLLLLPTLLGAGDRENWMPLSILVLYGALAVPLIVIQYLRFQYVITPTELIIRSGVLTTRTRNIPVDRIQNIEIEQSLLPRLLGTAKVKIETAGSTSTEGVLEYVSLEEAHDIRETIRTYQRGRRASETGPRPEVDPGKDKPVEEGRAVLFSMPLSRVLLSGAFRFSLLYIALIFSALQYLMDAWGLEPDDIADWLLRDGLQPYTEIARSSPVTLAALTILIAAILGWCTGVLVNLNRYYGFELWLEGDKLQKRHGLLTVSEGTFPLEKVQALIVRTNPLMRYFGWYRLELQTMGYDVEEQGYQVAVPFARETDILTLAPHIHPVSLPERFESVSPVTIRRHFIRYTVLLLLVALPLCYFWRPALWSLTAIPLLLGYAVLQYRNHGYAFQDDVLFIRRGVFQQYLWMIPVEKFQVFYLERSFFQRRLDLLSVVVDTAGAGTFTYPQIVDAEKDAGEAFVNALYTRFQTWFEREPAISDDEEPPAPS